MESMVREASHGTLIDLYRFDGNLVAIHSNSDCEELMFWTCTSSRAALHRWLCDGGSERRDTTRAHQVMQTVAVHSFHLGARVTHQGS